MKKILVWLLFMAFSMLSYGQYPNIVLEIKGNTIIGTTIPSNNSDYSFSFIVSDASQMLGLGNYVELKATNSTVVKKIVISNIATFKVDGVAAPITYLSIRDSLKNHAALTGGGSGSSGSGTATSTSGLQQINIDSITKVIAATKVVGVKVDTTNAIAARDAILQDTANARLLRIANSPASSDSIYIKRITDSLHKQIDTLRATLVQLKLIKYYDSLTSIRLNTLLDTTIQGNIDRRTLATEATLQLLLEQLEVLSIKDYATETTLKDARDLLEAIRLNQVNSHPVTIQDGSGNTINTFGAAGDILPANVTPTSANNSQVVSFSPNGNTVKVALYNGVVVETPLTITTANVAQIALPFNANRTGFEIINTSAFPIYINLTGAATLLSIPLQGSPVNGAKGSYSRYVGKIPTNAISIISATAGATFTVLESN